MDFDTFLNWERTSRDTIDVKKIYIDMAGDLVAGVMLSQIVYWYLPSKQGKPKIVIQKGGKEWIAKARHEWWDECRVSPKQVDRALKLLVNLGILETRLFKFNNMPTKHVRINKEPFLTMWQAVVFTERVNPFLPKGEKPFYPKGKNQVFDESVKSITKTTAEITTENTTKKKEPSRKSASDAPKRSKEELDAMYDAVAAVWDTAASGFIVSIRDMLMGCAKRGAWKQCNFTHAATSDEIRAFAKWWSFTKLAMPTKPESIQRHFYEYRRKVQKQPENARREAPNDAPVEDDIQLPPDVLSANPELDRMLKDFAAKMGDYRRHSDKPLKVSA